MTCLSLFVLLLTPACSSDNTSDNTLHKAAGTSNPDVVKALISAGAKVNAKVGKYGQTPLHLAAGKNSNPDVVKALISAGAKVNAKNKYGETPLHLAAFNKNPDVVKALVNAGAEVTQAIIRIANNNENINQSTINLLEHAIKKK